MAVYPDRLTAWRRIGRDYNGGMVRKAFEEVYLLFGEIKAGIEGVAGQPGQPGPGAPTVQSLDYPFVVKANNWITPPEGHVMFPDVTPGSVQAALLTWCEMVCDPTALAPSGAVTFTLQDDRTTPTNSATVTFATGQRYASSWFALLIPAGKRLHIKTPAALNGLQNLYRVRIRVEGITT